MLRGRDQSLQRPEHPDGRPPAERARGRGDRLRGAEPFPFERAGAPTGGRMLDGALDSRRYPAGARAADRRESVRARRRRQPREVGVSAVRGTPRAAVRGVLEVLYPAGGGDRRAHLWRGTAAPRCRQEPDRALALGAAVDGRGHHGPRRLVSLPLVLLLVRPDGTASYNLRSGS